MGLQWDDGSFTQMAEGQEQQADRVLNVQFRMQPVKDEAASAEAGRPIFKPVEFIRIIAPGDRDMVDRPVWDGDKKRFAAKYERFKTNGQNTITGTPLSVWPTIASEQVEELKFFNVFTVEQLAEMPDSSAQKIGPLSDLRAKAKLFLDAAKSNAPMEKLQAEVKARTAENEAMKQRIAQLEAFAAKHAKEK